MFPPPVVVGIFSSSGFSFSCGCSCPQVVVGIFGIFGNSFSILILSSSQMRNTFNQLLVNPSLLKKFFNNNHQLCSFSSNLAKGSYGHKVIWVMIAFLFTLAFIKAFIHFCPQLHTITVHCIQWYGAIRKSLMVGTYVSWWFALQEYFLK